MSSVLVISAQWTNADILCYMRILSFHEHYNHQKLLKSCMCMGRQEDGGVRGKLNHYSSACCNTASGKYIVEVKVLISSDTEWAVTYLLLTAFCVGFSAFSVAEWRLHGVPSTTSEEEEGEFSSRLWPFKLIMTWPPFWTGWKCPTQFIRD